MFSCKNGTWELGWFFFLKKVKLAWLFFLREVLLSELHVSNYQVVICKVCEGKAKGTLLDFEGNT